MLSLPNGETSDVSSEAEGGQGEAESEIPDTEQNDLADCQSETTMDPQRSIIEDIRFVPSFHSVILAMHCLPLIYTFFLLLFSLPDRKSEFGIGVELGAEGQKLMQVHQDRLGRSLDRLSTELYSKDTHFVLELIQVASTTFTPIKMSPNSCLFFTCYFLYLFI